MAARVSCIGIGVLLAVWAYSDSPVIGGGAGFGLVQAVVLGIGVITAIAGLMPARIAVPYLLLLISCFATLVLAEIALSALLGARYYTAYSFDPRYLFKLEPGASREYANLPVNGGNTVVYRINSDGFRGPELETAGERPRVLVYGDSFIHAEFSDLGETFPVQLANRLSAVHGTDAEVVNAGVAGYGPDQVLRRMEDELEWMKPDLVLVALFSGNDFGDLLRNRLYRLSEDGQLVENEYRLSDEQLRQIELNRSEPVLRKMLQEALNQIRGSAQDTFVFDKRQWIEDALSQHLAEYEAFVVDGDSTVGAFGVDPYSADIALLPHSPSADYKIRLLNRIVERIGQVAAEHSIPVVAVIIPHPLDLLDGDHASGWVDKTKFPNYAPTRLSDAMVSIAENNSVPYLNLFPDFQREDVEALFLRGGDDHWNSAGQKLAAELVASFLTEGGYLDTWVGPEGQ